MVRRSWLPTAAICIGLASAGCAAKVATRPAQLSPTATARPTTSPGPAPQTDAVADLLALSNRHFAAGQRELEIGHLEQAKAEFNRALDVLLESPYGARFEPRLRAHFDRLVDRISAYEMAALAQGDGFTEKRYEPASIDDLLAASTFEQPPATAATEVNVAADLRATEHDLPIPLNAKVLSYVELFQTRLKEWVEGGLSRGSRYLPMIQDVLRAEGLPLDLAYVPLIESAFNPNALSRAKAKGVWQFMRGTALENGLKHDWYIDERADPRKATEAAAKYLKTLSNMFEGDWHLALASYNAGPGAVSRAVRRFRQTDFWKLAERPRALPRETREYVPMILAAVIVAKNPLQYGLNVQPVETPKYEHVTLPGPTDLRRVAEWTGTSVKDIQDLNPELRRWTTPVRAQNYEIKVPDGTATLLQARLDEWAPEAASFKWHVVKRGESLATIARKLRVSRADLAEANYLSPKSRVAPGQKLIIPRAPATLLATRVEGPPPPVAEAHAVPDVADKAPRAELTAGARVVYYRVRRGDTLFAIARLYRTTVAQLKSWNRIIGSTIAAGSRLAIHTSVSPKARGVARRTARR